MTYNPTQGIEKCAEFISGNMYSSFKYFHVFDDIRNYLEMKKINLNYISIVSVDDSEKYLSFMVPSSVIIIFISVLQTWMGFSLL